MRTPVKDLAIHHAEDAWAEISARHVPTACRTGGWLADVLTTTEWRKVNCRSCRKARYRQLHPDGVCRHEGTRHTETGDVDCPLLR